MSTDETAALHCGYCTWTDLTKAKHDRIDLAVYTTIWEHVQAAHYLESVALRSLTIDERKKHIGSWGRVR